MRRRGERSRQANGDFEQDFLPHCQDPRGLPTTLLLFDPAKDNDSSGSDRKTAVLLWNGKVYAYLMVDMRSRGVESSRPPVGDASYS